MNYVILLILSWALIACKIQVDVSPPSALIDNSPPSIISISAPAAGVYLTNPGSHLDFTVNFNENILVTGTPALTLTVGTTNRKATYFSRIDSDSLVFRYTTNPTDDDSNGITLHTSWDFTDGNLTNSSSLAAASSFSALLLPELEDVKVNRSPSVVSFNVTESTYTYLQNLDIHVTFSEVVIGTSSRLVLNVGGSTRYAVYQSGSGTGITYRWTNTGGLSDTEDGITIITPIDLNGGTLKDSSNNDAILTFTSPNTSGVLVDGNYPVPVTLSYYGVNNFTYMPGGSAAQLYPTLTPATVVNYSLNSILNTWNINSSSGAITYSTGVHSATTRTIRATNTSGETTTALTTTSLPIIYKNQILLGTNINCALASGGLDCWKNDFTYQVNLIPYGTGAEHIFGIGENVCVIVPGDGIKCFTNSISINRMIPYLGFTVLEASDGTPVDKISQVAAGPNHTCYLRLGKAYCFGDNTYGQSGGTDGSYEETSQLVSETILFQKIAVGQDHTCGLSGRNLYCWGRNLEAQLGGLDSTSPPPMTSTSNPYLSRTLVSDFTLGLHFTCAVSSALVYCFGKNSSGELGRTGPAGSETLATININNVIQIKSHPSASYVIALLSNGQTYGWGNLSQFNSSLGAAVTTPTILSGLSYVSQVVAGPNRAFLQKNLSSSQSAAWIDSQNGNVIGGFNPNASFNGLSAGYDGTCVHLSSTPHCFGSNAANKLTQRTLSTFLPLNSLFANSFDTDHQLNQRIITTSSIGGAHGCYQAGEKTICAGNVFPGDPTNYGTGVLVNTPSSGAKKICSGNSFTCSLGINQNLECWGDNSSKQINPTGPSSYTTPQVINEVAMDIACMADAVCIIKANNRIFCQGDGYGTSGLTEVLTGRPSERFTRLKAGSNFACAETDDHKLICFGENDQRQLGNNSVTDTTNGVLVMDNNLSGIIHHPVKEFTLGSKHVCATGSGDGVGIEKLFCWGQNNSGQVHPGNAATPITATNIPLRTNYGTIYDMAAGASHTCLHINGGFQCFGDTNVIGIDSAKASLSEFNPILPFIYR